ncbi:hypothetical protein [Clostridium sp. C105KSO13]|nr:hypothetical protein [Clostridium sp. C105KSO13]
MNQWKTMQMNMTLMDSMCMMMCCMSECAKKTISGFHLYGM